MVVEHTQQPHDRGGTVDRSWQGRMKNGASLTMCLRPSLDGRCAVSLQAELTGSVVVINDVAVLNLAHPLRVERLPPYIATKILENFQNEPQGPNDPAGREPGGGAASKC